MRQPLDSVIAEYDQNFRRCWKAVFSAYRDDACGDRVWLAGPSSYVFSLSGQRFAVDLQIRRGCDFDALRDGLCSDLSDLSFILITHQHDDHMCLPLMRALKDMPIRWYIPAGTKPELIAASGLPDDRITYVHDGDRWQIGELKIRAFYSPHVEPEDECFPQCGYMITTPNGCILLPGDVRDYTYSGYPDFPSVDICFSHLWAGNDALDPDNYGPMLEKFVEFNAGFRAKRYFLCHLYELGRKPLYMWTYAHAGLAMDAFLDILPGSVVEIPRVGCAYGLFEAGKEWWK